MTNLSYIAPCLVAATINSLMTAHFFEMERARPVSVRRPKVMSAWLVSFTIMCLTRRICA